MKNMKKKVVIVAAMVLLLATVLVMSMSTFAKYTSSSTQSANATVAKWGLVLKADTAELFGENYGAKNADGLSAVATGAGVNVVASEVVVAPGTTGSMSFDVDGTADVAAAVTFSITDVTEIALGDGTNTYYPVVWTLTTEAAPETVLKSGKLADIKAYFDTLGAVAIPAGGTISTKYVLTWEWAFENSAASSSGVGTLSCDQADTLLGLKAAGETIDAAYTTAQTSMSFTISANFVQTQS